MANTVALLLNAPPGSTVITQKDAHVLTSEANAGAALGGLWLTAVDADGAQPPLASWERALGPMPDAQRSPVALVVLENTHTRTGGVALTPDYTDGVIELTRSKGCAAHLDGSRLFYAACALGLRPGTLAAGFDTVSVSLNKTFGAPIAAALAASAAQIERALTLRQRLGGGLRPTGAVSAATLAGLDDLAHLAQCNALAMELREALSTIALLAPERPPHQTNIVLTRLAPPWTAGHLCERLAAAGILALPLADDRVRFVTYRGIGARDIERVVDALRDILQRSAS
jgi:threonine aldolase